MKTTDKEVKLFSVPISYGQELVPNDRYVLAVLVHLQSKAKTPFNGRLWFYLPIRAASGKAHRNKKYRALAQYFPWISASALHGIVKRLVKGKYLHIGQHNVRTSDKTLWYSVPEKVCKACKRALVRYFNPEEAAKPLSINCALVLNVIYRDFHLKVAKQDQRLVFNRYAMSKDLGLPLSTINSVFTKLEQVGHLTPLVSSEGKAYTLNVPNSCTLKGNGKGRKSVSKVICIVSLEPEQYATAQKMLSEINLKARSTAHAHKMNLRQMLEETYLMQIEREQMVFEKEQKAQAKKQRVRRPVVVENKRVSRVEAEANLPERQADRLFATRMRRARNKRAKEKELALLA